MEESNLISFEWTKQDNISYFNSASTVKVPIAHFNATYSSVQKNNYKIHHWKQPAT